VTKKGEAITRDTNKRVVKNAKKNHPTATMRWKRGAKSFSPPGGGGCRGTMGNKTYGGERKEHGS